MKIFYHNDMDGKCSAAIVYNHIFENWTVKPNDLELIEIDYKDSFPFKKIVQNEQIIIVDYSLESLDDWNRLLNITQNIDWIDHHKTAIKQFDKFGLKGIRQSGKAACLLTWEYYKHYEKTNDEIPMTVKYLADYEYEFEFGELTDYFQLGIRVEDTHPASKNWVKWLSNSYDTGEILANGLVVRKFTDLGSLIH